MKKLIIAITALLGFASNAWADDYNIIDTQPAGEVTHYDRVSYGWYIYAGGNQLQYGQITGPTKIVWGTDGYAYILNPLTANKTGTYIKATRDGNTLRADFPQVLCELQDNSGSRPLYIGKMQPWDDGNGVTYMPTESNDYITWTIHDDGIITMDHDPVALNDQGKLDEEAGFPADVLGTYYYGIDDATGEYGAIWNAVADWAQTYTPVTTNEILEIPANLEIEAWRLTSKDKTRVVDVAIDGNTMYIAGITPYAPGAIIGTIENGKVSFATGQYLGFNETYSANAWFLSAFAEYIEYFDRLYLDHFNLTEALVFNYDIKRKTLTTEPDACFIINSSLTTINHFEYFVEPVLKYLNPNGMNAAPKDPVILVPGRDEGLDGILFSVNIPDDNVNGVPLNNNRMYYNIYLNGQLWTFYTDTYYYFSEDITDIPYTYTDTYDLTVKGNVHDLYLHEEGIESIGIVSCFVGSDGVVYKSNLVSTVEDGVYDITHSPVVDTRYTDLLGREVKNPGAGLFILTETHANGAVTSRKVSIK